jgi:hypothetical protein
MKSLWHDPVSFIVDYLPFIMLGAIFIVLLGISLSGCTGYIEQRGCNPPLGSLFKSCLFG